MQILLHTDSHVDGNHPLAGHLDTVVKDALGHFGERITRVEAHISDANSHSKTNPEDVHCTLEARLKGREPVAVKDHAPTAHQAIHGAIGKLKRAVTTVLEKRDDRRHPSPLSDVAPDETRSLPEG